MLTRASELCRGPRHPARRITRWACIDLRSVLRLLRRMQRRQKWTLSFKPRWRRRRRLPLDYLNRRPLLHFRRCLEGLRQRLPRQDFLHGLRLLLRVLLQLLRRLERRYRLPPLPRRRQPAAQSPRRLVQAVWGLSGLYRQPPQDQVVRVLETRCRSSRCCCDEDTSIGRSVLEERCPPYHGRGRRLSHPIDTNPNASSSVTWPLFTSTGGDHATTASRSPLLPGALEVPLVCTLATRSFFCVESRKGYRPHGSPGARQYERGASSRFPLRRARTTARGHLHVVSRGQEAH